MANLTIRRLDDAIRDELRLRAARNGRSVEDEVRVILREAAQHQAPAPALPVPGEGPAAEPKAACGVFFGPAGRLHHAIEGNEGGGNQLSHAPLRGCG